MSDLGLLVWYSVSGDKDGVEQNKILDLFKQHGITAPKPPLPIDVFRRLTGIDGGAEYDLDDDTTVHLELHKVESQKTMLVRHIVRTVKRNGVNVSIDKVGDVAFYRPPRGKPERSRMRVTPFPENYPDRKEIEAFAEALRVEYSRALNVLDPQAVRRLVRRLLTDAGAIYLDGPWFVLDEDRLHPLYHLFALLDFESYIHHVPMPDTAYQREYLTGGLERLVAAGTTVPDEIWARLEGEPNV